MIVHIFFGKCHHRCVEYKEKYFDFFFTLKNFIENKLELWRNRLSSIFKAQLSKTLDRMILLNITIVGIKKFGCIYIKNIIYAKSIIDTEAQLQKGRK